MNADRAGEYTEILSCGCRRVLTSEPRGGWWQGQTCLEHERPGGWESWNAYRKAWKHTLCCVCGVRGIQDRNDFESIWVGDGMIYAHRSCYTLANIFEDMRPDAAMVNRCRAERPAWS